MALFSRSGHKLDEPGLKPGSFTPLLRPGENHSRRAVMHAHGVSWNTMPLF